MGAVFFGICLDEFILSILLRQQAGLSDLPYPKTHNPAYEAAVKEKLTAIIHDTGSPLLPLINKRNLLKLISGESDLGKPWFGQLMALPQLYAYLIQMDHWLRKYKISIKI